MGYVTTINIGKTKFNFMKKDKTLSKSKNSNTENLKEKLKRESLLVREKSMEILKEFELL